MNKVGFFRSIHLKFVIIYVLLILIAMQIVSAYFVRQLEDTLNANFKTTIENQMKLLSYYLEEQFVKERVPEDGDATLEVDLRRLLQDYNTDDISEVAVIEGTSMRVLGTSNVSDQSKVGQKMSNALIRTSIKNGQPNEQDSVINGKRVWIYIKPIIIDNDVKGVIYVTSKIENVYTQMREIIKIFSTGTAIALILTAVLSVLLAQTITRPITDMRKQALAMAKGNYSRKVKIYGQDEIGQLAMTFNSLTRKLQEAQATTEGERRKLSSVLTFMTDGVIATDRKGRVILINEPAAEMLHVSRETVLSNSIVSLLGLEEDYTFEELLEERESVILDYSDEKSNLILRANFSVIQKETGFINGLITVLHDITEQEKIEEERREFVANVSHELRTPLTTMRSYLEALTDGAWQDKEIAPNFLDVTQNETERMIRLVNDLLQLSKMDSSDYQLNKEWVDFTQFYNRIIDRFEFTKQQNVTFERRVPTTADFVEIDTDKLTQVLDNIISNAMKYSPEGGKITFSIEEQEGYLIISVADEGMGIPKENVSKIFNRFYRVDKARTRKLGGTGLGLAIAKEMVEAHGGEIWAESIEGKGTTISFSLPYIRSEEDDWE
ncbi:cell wall metabolism sensor histidine kinase WalK [Cytobacillus sp. FSL W7-1323]|uniref:histidine kinase n=1 Tax=Cytobacillus kochii TaxID=859143 RepID=A0A248THV6_9BACI|nr:MULTISPECIES: cell wall metabolism sensor histidine kinase WalK [Cytobacillus]ASV67788.1 cell wall metabolism sensor histidine kinase WalK [Cytobacillus kochii]MCA1026617.1 cell wall metabolism sensor histidine kinase WalK [Cytobacillus kochii]MCM3322240.1 cell wall metabolism sensor histidine kinase WalK [Cytobacillus kochii]MCM3345282.1 cell wall metabolism sensor histidine kinase WalK [Cytobacillus kochii]MDM5209835.1 cell wall metabolism sensor histidine kinase WalK [Cytobacillus kochii